MFNHSFNPTGGGSEWCIRWMKTVQFCEGYFEITRLIVSLASFSFHSRPPSPLSDLNWHSNASYKAATLTSSSIHIFVRQQSIECQRWLCLCLHLCVFVSWSNLAIAEISFWFLFRKKCFCATTMIVTSADRIYEANFGRKSFNSPFAHP